MAEGNKVHRGSLSEAVQGPQPKPALGPPHDVYAAVGLTFAGAGMLFFAGRARVEWDALGWTGMLICCAALVAIVLYFQRAYGFSSTGWGNSTTGAGLAAMLGFMIVLQFVPAALYAQIFDDSLFGYVVVCLGFAMFGVGILRAALGAAEAPPRPDETESGSPGPVGS